MTEISTRKLKVFLCHASEDKPMVREIYQRLKTEDWIDPWLDEEKLLPGQDWDIEIEKAVEDADAVLVCLSTGSVSKEGYVQKELRYVINLALMKPDDTIFIIPIRLDNCSLPRNLRRIQYVDYFPVIRKDWAYNRILDSLKVRFSGIGENQIHVKKHLAEVEKNILSDKNQNLEVSNDFYITQAQRKKYSISLFVPNEEAYKSAAWKELFHKSRIPMVVSFFVYLVLFSSLYSLGEGITFIQSIVDIGFYMALSLTIITSLFVFTFSRPKTLVVTVQVMKFFLHDLDKILHRLKFELDNQAQNTLVYKRKNDYVRINIEDVTAYIYGDWNTLRFVRRWLNTNVSK